jgi:hypothetical protein
MFQLQRMLGFAGALPTAARGLGGQLFAMALTEAPQFSARPNPAQSTPRMTPQEARSVSECRALW